MVKNKAIIIKSALYGIAGAVGLLGLYFTIISLISGRNFALSQFFQFRYFVVSLAIGFGIQLGLYVYLRSMIRGSNDSGKILAVSGTTSAGAMISCCTHYLANILPIIGVAGFISIIGQYQIELFWIGIGFNVAGIVYISRKVFIFYQR